MKAAIIAMHVQRPGFEDFPEGNFISFMLLKVFEIAS